MKYISYYSQRKKKIYMIPYLSSKVLRKSLLKEVERLLQEKGYSEKAIKEILKWYDV